MSVAWPGAPTPPAGYHVAQNQVGASTPVFFRYKTLRVPEIMSGLCPVSSREYTKREFHMSFNFDCLSGVLTRKHAHDRLEYWRARYRHTQSSPAWRDAHNVVDLIFSLHVGMKKEEIMNKLRGRNTCIHISEEMIYVSRINLYIHGDLLDLDDHQRQHYIELSIQANSLIQRNNPFTTLPQFKDLPVYKLLGPKAPSAPTGPKKDALAVKERLPTALRSNQPQMKKQPPPPALKTAMPVVNEKEKPTVKKFTPGLLDVEDGEIVLDISPEFMEVPPSRGTTNTFGLSQALTTLERTDQNRAVTMDDPPSPISRRLVEQSTQTDASFTPETPARKFFISARPRPVFGQTGFASYAGASPYLGLGPSPGERQFQNLTYQQEASRDLFAQVERDLSSEKAREGSVDTLKRKKDKNSPSPPTRSPPPRPVPVSKENPKMTPKR